MKLCEKSLEVINDAVTIDCDDGESSFIPIGSFNQFSYLARTEHDKLTEELQAKTDFLSLKVSE